MNRLARHPVAAVDDLPWVIASEFDEQPGLRLTFHQVRRLWGLSATECQNILDYLVTSGTLVFDADDRYCRPTEHH